ncbi:MAG: alpha/beta hydrolase [Bacteroidota bacterium]
MKHRVTLSERIKKALALAALKLPLSMVKLLIGQPIEIDGQTMDPYIQLMVKFFTSHEAGYIPTPEEERREFDIQGTWFAHDPEPTVSITKWIVDGRNGQVPCEIHRPEALPATDAPALVYFHGGGFLSGSLDSHRDLCRQLAHEINCAVIAVDYRLAPEHKFPTGINDCLDTYDAVVDQADNLGLNPNRISVGGDSAGGNAAAVVAQQRKSTLYPPKFQALWVPWLDLSKQTRSYDLMGEGFFLEKKKITWYSNHYLNHEADGLNPLASPALGTLAGACPAAIFIAGFDPLRDEGVAYGQMLKAANVPTEIRLYEGLIHPFMNVAGKVPTVRQSFREIVDILRRNM